MIPLDQETSGASPNIGLHRSLGAAAEPLKSRGGPLLDVVRLLARTAARDQLPQPHDTAVEARAGDKQSAGITPSGTGREGAPD
jgi:hypothetical protein